MSASDPVGFSNTYVKLPERFYERINPVPVKEPKLLFFNAQLAEHLGLTEISKSSDESKAEVFSGNKVLPSSEPIALAYAGHQFAHFVPQLGDGRANLLGEIVASDGSRKDIQLKGSGRNKFSRRGDGRSALGPALREYIMSEAMFFLGVPTARSLAVVATGEDVQRDELLPGGIVTRVAASHIRVGTFEYFAFRKDEEALRLLADYAIERHYPELKFAEKKYVAFYEKVVEKQAKLVAQWMCLGFIHGVMNTDNVSISGETFDYGPCAFMDEFHPQMVFSSIDEMGRYAYGQQGAIAQWNMKILASTLLPLFDSVQERAIEIANASLETFEKHFNEAWIQGISAKLGMRKAESTDQDLITRFLELLQKYSIDYTLSFRSLAEQLKTNSDTEIKSLLQKGEDMDEFLKYWMLRVRDEGVSDAELVERMNAVNPIYIPRNHRVEAALEAVVRMSDLSKMTELLEVLRNPYKEVSQYRAYIWGPKPEERVLRTFCGT